ncbi:UDP-N-acetylmuramoyl-L-alanine--D-glutamate ligase [Roseateles sp. BYS180W]|uniref:UDP-N-acetylmuramoylalanine--D-glutamate ligase n=1 Tax=Roseateles rivi TaxID=3299028 RepID=A0ABW7FRN2_9BURK
MDFPRLHQDAHALVLGLGDSGLAMAKWLQNLGAGLTVWDSREQPPQLQALREACPQAQFISGALAPEALQGVTLLCKSPGLSPLDERLAPLLTAAKAQGLRVQGELDLFAQALAQLRSRYGYKPDVLAITGTNGKTTTTCMTALLVECAGRRVGLAGNIGPTLLDTLTQALGQEPQREDWVPPVPGSAVPAPLAAELPPAEVAEVAAADASVDTPPAEPAEPAEPADSPAEAEPELLTERPLPIALPTPVPPPFEALPEVWVLELSSFQLDEVQGFEPSAAAVLNLSQDHLDWHGDMPAYGRAKARIFGQDGVVVVNRDDPQVLALVPAPVMVKGSRGRPSKQIERRVLRFGLDMPRRPGDFGLQVEQGMAWLVRAREPEPGIKLRPGEVHELHIQRLMPADALRVRGRHNAANALAALALASSIGCPLAPMLHGLREYRGEPHRVEFVQRLDEVDFYDDSKGTNVGATVAAILGLGADRAPAKLVLILGGDGKGQDFSPLATPVALHARAVALIGRDAPQLRAALADCGVPLQDHATLEEATRWCAAQAQAGDSVLLSPACASLDMFRNYAHRAEVFVQTVQALAQDQGYSV